MYIIAGLGNPGREYAHTRHNTGFDAIDALADKYRIEFNMNKFRGVCGTGVIEGQKVLLLKPSTYMNLSGESIREACNFYKIDPEEGLIVLYDDISLAPGQLRVRKKGSAGGHNGIKNIISQLGTQVFKRVKIGVGEKPAQFDLADYVLGHFSREDQITMIRACEEAAAAAAMLVYEEPDVVMNKYNTKKESSKAEA